MIEDYVRYFANEEKGSGFSEPGWYYEDEAYFLHGPYDTEKEARKNMVEYVNRLNNLM